MLADIGLLGAILIAYLLSRRRYQDTFTPMFVYVSTWCAALFLFRLRLINYDELEPGTIAIIAGSMVAFVLGCMIAGKNAISRPTAIDLSTEPLQKAIKLLLFMNFVGLGFYLIKMQGTLGLLLYFTDPSEIHGSFDDLGRIGPVALLLLVNFPVFACSLIHFLKAKKLHWFSTVGLGLPLIQSYVFADRNSLAIAAITSLFVWIYFNQWRQFNRKILKVASALACLIATYFMVGGLLYGKLISSESKSYNEENYNVTSGAAIALANPYMYATGAFPTMQAAIADVHGKLWGSRTFFPAARLLYGIGLIQQRPENASMDFYFVPIPFNTYTHLFSFYEDFGLAGAILLPFLLGWWQTKSYLEMKLRPTLFSIGATAAFMTINIYSIFIALESTILIWYFFSLIFVVSRACSSNAPFGAGWKYSTDRGQLLNEGMEF
jgi:oligosaccharide repeat unit polymerase